MQKNNMQYNCAMRVIVLENAYQMTDILKLTHFNGYSPEAGWNPIIPWPSPSSMVWPQPSSAPDLMSCPLLLWLVVPILSNSFLSGSLRTLLPLPAHSFSNCVHNIPLSSPRGCQFLGQAFLDSVSGNIPP